MRGVGEGDEGAQGHLVLGGEGREGQRSVGGRADGRVSRGQ